MGSGDYVNAIGSVGLARRQKIAEVRRLPTIARPEDICAAAAPGAAAVAARPLPRAPVAAAPPDVAAVVHFVRSDQAQVLARARRAAASPIAALRVAHGLWEPLHC